MKNKEFLEEVLNSNLCPKNFEKIYHDFEFYQNKAFEVLLAFHEICEKNKIPYIMGYGSLLGVIRDGGQIPWDYDIDVCVPFEKRNELIKALDNDLPKEIYYNYLNNNKKSRNTIMRLAPKGFLSEILHVDVFFFVGAPDDDKLRKEMAKKIKLISNIRFYKYADIEFEGYKNPKLKLKLIIRRLQYMLVPIKYLMKEYYGLCENYPAMKSKYNYPADIHADLVTYESKNLWNTMLKKIDSNHELRIPIEYDKILTKLYGDYKKIPELSQRIKEVTYHYKKLLRSKIDE